MLTFVDGSLEFLKFVTKLKHNLIIFLELSEDEDDKQLNKLMVKMSDLMQDMKLDEKVNPTEASNINF